MKLTPAQVVQVKVFLTPASSADEVLAEVKKLFPGQLTPPVVFVEWIASAPVEIELIAQLPPTDKPAESVQYYTPPDVRPSPAFSRVALVRSRTADLHLRPVRARKRATARPRPATCLPS